MKAPRIAVLSTALAAAWACDARAVMLSDAGIGQALIYPYYTVQDGAGGSFNTYLSVVNTTTRGKAVRVRFREARNGREAAAFNVYLAPNDTWTAAMVPNGDGTKLVTADASCVDPPIGSGLAFSNAAFSGAHDDGAGTGLDRTREGYVEMLEMANLTGIVASGVTPNVLGMPANCAATRAGTSANFLPPNGGLFGSLTLINVADGADYTVNATALADVAHLPYFRQPEDPYPTFAAAEIVPSSLVQAKGIAYRSDWSRGVDAVSAVLMQKKFSAEFVLDSVTASATDIVMSFPTKPLLAGTATPSPFSGTSWSAACDGERTDTVVFNREASGYVMATDLPLLPDTTVRPCSAAFVLSMLPSTTSQRLAGSRIDGAVTSAPVVNSGFANGVLEMSMRNGRLVSLPSSVRVSADGSESTGAHAFDGLPIVGFMMRVLRNGTLSCGGTPCQGNYGSAFPLRTTRSISP